ncbi:hypothetical protein PAXRUDRAFT_829246 [Paxillus rubicundulus Ve08.2h10]|uniref:Secreted protein n=1 Tax=Paxillus rubicundulus Ve08.2h10 TaxID=930991 RepID=A0A0D0E0B5_9AGAM|nr:hypothetical protein PAXRUDRAFT_829246 [Paxillus rubicundulus Ve08.2h10]
MVLVAMFFIIELPLPVSVDGSCSSLPPSYQVTEPYPSFASASLGAKCASMYPSTLHRNVGNDLVFPHIQRAFFPLNPKFMPSSLLRVKR